MVDFVETKRKGNRSQRDNHRDVNVLGFKQLLDVAAIALAMMAQVSFGTYMRS